MRSQIKFVVLSFQLLILLSASVFGGEKNQVREYKLSNGIPVYLMDNTANKVDAVYVGIKGGTKYYSPEMSGIEAATFTMMGKGSASFTYDDLRSLKFKTSSSISVSSGYYGSYLSLSSIDEYLEETLPMLLEAFISPRFEQEQFDKIYNDMKGSVQQIMNDPTSLASYYTRKLFYQGHPYETLSSVTPESIGNISLTAVKKYYQTLLDSRRFYVIAVTKQKDEVLLETLEHYLSVIPTQTTELLKEPEVMPPAKLNKEPCVLTHQSISNSGHIYRAVLGPASDSEDFIPLKLAEIIYEKILHNVVRAKYGVCYSAWTEDYSNKANVIQEVLYRVSDFSEVKAQLAEARQIMAEGKYIISTNPDGSFVYADIKDGFEGFRNTLINALYTTEMTTSARANTINSSLLVFGNTNGLDIQREKINTVTWEQTVEVFKKYYLSDNEFWYGVVGPEDEEYLYSVLK